jgi:hypothetical protein
MKKGVVVEYDDDFVTLLTPDGQFLKANNKEGNYELGEEISFFPSMDEREEAVTRTTRAKKKSFSDYFNRRIARVVALSTIAIIFFTISSLPFFNNDEVYAYMSIDINPSFEIGIDDQLTVISLEPLNEEAEKLIEKLPEWENKQFDDIVDAIVAASKSESYVYPGKEIVITTVINDEDKDVQTKLEEGINEIRTTYENEEMVVKTIESDTETREKALNQGISTGKYLKLQENANPAVDETIKDVKEPVEKQEQVEESSTVEKEKIGSVPESGNGNSQSVKEKLITDTKEELKEAKNKLQENTQKNNNNEKKQEANKQKQKEHKEKKSVEKNRNGKDNRNNHGDRDNEDDRDDWDNRDEWEDRVDKDHRDRKHDRGREDD